ncbi:MAG: glycerol-3-phosphate 1-O-acyltransferase PlsY [Candidatus Aminicenantaceae bacterium]
MKTLFVAASYFLGAIPSGYIIYRWVTKEDIRNFGSKNIGFTNVLRLLGLKYALPVLIFDFAKGFIPPFLALKIFPDSKLALLCALFAILGHCFPVYIKFKGGKGIATMMGIYAALDVYPFLICLGVFVLVSGISRYVSLGSLTSSLSYPIILVLFDRNLNTIFLFVIIFLLILLRHRDNVKRLIRGNERKLGDANQ